MKYTDSHEWVLVDGEIATIGVSEYAQGELGDIVYVELPEEGQEVNSGDDVAVLESTKAAADVYAPISGTITEVNEILKDNPELINDSPQDRGWIYKIKIKNPREIDELMEEEEYKGQFS